MTVEQLAKNIVDCPYTNKNDSLYKLAQRVIELESLVEDLNQELDDLYDIDELEDVEWDLEEDDCL